MKNNKQDNRKIYVIGGHDHYAEWILPLGFEITNDLASAAICLGCGGEDWHHGWYDCKNPHSSMGTNLRRDIYEMEILNKAIRLKIPIVGICRSSQILPALVDKNRGRAVQHQTNPGFIHKIKTYDGLELFCSSTHHACAWPYGLEEGSEYKLLAWSRDLLNFRYLDAKWQDLVKSETEIVVYPNTGGGLLGYQNHPEMELGLPDHVKSIKWYQETLLKFLDGGFK